MCTLRIQNLGCSCFVVVFVSGGGGAEVTPEPAR